jgi:hypothetical protein
MNIYYFSFTLANIVGFYFSSCKVPIPDSHISPKHPMPLGAQLPRSIPERTGENVCSVPPGPSWLSLVFPHELWRSGFAHQLCAPPRPAPRGMTLFCATLFFKVVVPFGFGLFCSFLFVQNLFLKGFVRMNWENNRTYRWGEARRGS